MTKLLTFRNYLKEMLEKHKLDNAEYLAALIISNVLQINHTDLYILPDKELTEEENNKILRFVEKLKLKEPIDLILKTSQFYHSNFEIAKGVFIPRPETEQLVEEVVQIIKKQRAKSKVQNTEIDTKAQRHKGTESSAFSLQPSKSSTTHHAPHTELGTKAQRHKGTEDSAGCGVRGAECNSERPTIVGTPNPKSKIGNQKLAGRDAQFGRLYNRKLPNYQITKLPNNHQPSAASHQPSTINQIFLLDIGTGCGVIAISLLREFPEIFVVAIDISYLALSVTKKNAAKFKVDERLFLLQSYLFASLKPEKTFDFVISNPPYVASDKIDSLDENVRNYDPLAALDGGVDGLEIIRKIIHNAKNYLKPNGYLIFEIGINQSAAVLEAMQESGYMNINIKKDLQNIDRIAIGCLP